MVPAHPLTVCLALLVCGSVAAACGSDDGDLEAFCAAYGDLVADDPFEELAVASPGEMRVAFEELAEGADRLADTAPSEVEVQATRYVGSVEVLVDQLRGAGFELVGLDLSDYRRATREYADAASSLERSAAATCP